MRIKVDYYTTEQAVAHNREKTLQPLYQGCILGGCYTPKKLKIA